MSSAILAVIGDNQARIAVLYIETRLNAKEGKKQTYVICSKCIA